MSVSQLLFNHAYWSFKVLGVSMCAALSASALTTYVSMSYLEALKGAGAAFAGGTDEEEAEEDEPATAAGGGFQEPARVDRTATNEKIVARGLFCPSCARTVPTEPIKPPTGEPGGREVTVADLAGARPCTLPLRLVATMEAGLSSWATIRDQEDGSVGPFGPDEFVRPGVSLVSIERTRVYVRNENVLEVLELGAEPPPPPPKKPLAKVKEAEKMVASNGLPGQADAVRCDSEHVCTISRDFVDSLFGNPMKLMGQARVSPSVQDGETRGFVFRGVKKDSLPQVLGITNGDIVTSVNGNSLQSIDQMMGLVTKLRRASNLSVQIERKGVLVTKEFEIK